jgi:hypothetical protein
VTLAYGSLSAGRSCSQVVDVHNISTMTTQREIWSGHILLKLLSPNASEAPALLALYSYGQIKGKHTLMNRKSLLSTP